MTRKTKKNILEDNNVMTLAAVVIIRRRRRRQEARKYTENGLVDGVRLERYPRSCDDIVDTVLGGFHNFAVIVSLVIVIVIVIVIVKIFSLSGSHTILDFPYQTSWEYSNGDPITGH